LKVNGKKKDDFDYGDDHKTEFVIMDEESIFTEEEYDFEGIKKFFNELREILQMDYQRRMEIWHNGTTKERAAVLEEDAEDYMYENFGYSNFRF